MAISERILILDFGSQYTQLIARRLRELSVYCEIHPCTVSGEFVRSFGAQGVILSGGPASVDEEGAPAPPAEVYDLDVPVLGVCYGFQSMTQHFGGQVSPSDDREFGRAMLQIDHRVGGQGDLFGRIAEDAPSQVWMSHSDRITQPGEGFVVTAQTDNGVPAAMAHTERALYGVQFLDMRRSSPLCIVRFVFLSFV